METALDALEVLRGGGGDKHWLQGRGAKKMPSVL